MKLKDVLTYIRRFEKKFALYISDSSVPHSAHWKGPKMKEMILKNLFNPPKYFEQNYMKYLGRKRRPCLFDPSLFTWILLLQVHGIAFYGEKLWLLFSPETTADILGLHDRHWQSEELIEQMRALYPIIKCNSWPQDCQPLAMLFMVLQDGDNSSSEN